MIITRTPYRISFFGGGTDYPVWLREHPGAVLSTTIDKYCFLSVRHLPAFFDHKSLIAYSRIERVKSVSEIRHPSVRACLGFVGAREGVELHHTGDLPARTGVGSSSSFTVGLLKALHALDGRMVSKQQLALDAIHVEQDLIREDVGCQDQIAAAYGGFNLVELRSSREFRVSPVTLPAARLAELEGHMMLFYTGLSRLASKIARAQVKQTPNKQRELKTMYDMVFEALELLNGPGDLGEFGRLLHEAWMLKRSLTTKTTNAVVDAIYETALKAGAFGGKLLGAGGGGFLLIFAPPERQARIRRALAKLLRVPIRFESQGSQVIVYRPV